MFVGILSITAAILLSIISAYFSIDGWMTLFSGAAIAAGVMGGVLEFAKVSATIWLYNFWKSAARIMKGYFLTAIAVLILISSIGIYGFLAESYVGQEAETSNIQDRIERVQQQIGREERRIENAEEQLSILDSAIERYIELNVVTRGMDSREEQREEREDFRDQIYSAEEQIADYEQQLLELKQEQNTQEVNVGPIKYIAAALYGETNVTDYYDNAARILILLFVFVFDPFAVLLMVAGNMSLYGHIRKERKEEIKEYEPKSKSEPEPELKPEPEPTKDENITEDDIQLMAQIYSDALDDNSLKESLLSSTESGDKKKRVKPQRNISYEEADQEIENKSTDPPKLHRKTRRRRKSI